MTFQYPQLGNKIIHIYLCTKLMPHMDVHFVFVAPGDVYYIDVLCLVPTHGPSHTGNNSTTEVALA